MENSWFCTICLNKFFSFNTNIRMLKDKLVSRIFMTAFQKVKLKRVSNVIALKSLLTYLSFQWKVKVFLLFWHQKIIWLFCKVLLFYEGGSEETSCVFVLFSFCTFQQLYDHCCVLIYNFIFVFLINEILCYFIIRGDQKV